MEAGEARQPGQGRPAAQSQKADDNQRCLALGPAVLPTSSPRGLVRSVDLGHSRSRRPSPGPGAFQTPLPRLCGQQPAGGGGRCSPGVPSAPAPPRPSRTVGALPTVGQAWAFMLSLTLHIRATGKPNRITIHCFSCSPRLPPRIKPPWPLPWRRAPPHFACTPPPPHSSPFGSHGVPFKT